MSNGDMPAMPPPLLAGAMFVPQGDKGLTKREYYAGLFLQAQMSFEDESASISTISAVLGIKPDHYKWDRDYPRYLAAVAIRQANELLTQLEVTK